MTKQNHFVIKITWKQFFFLFLLIFAQYDIA